MKISTCIKLLIVGYILLPDFGHAQHNIYETKFLKWQKESVCQTFASTFSENSLRNTCKYSPCDDSLAIYQNYPVDDIPIKNMQIRWVIFSDDDGGNTATNEEISTYMDYINEIFLPYKFQFETFEIVRYENTEINHSPLSDWYSQITYQETYGKHQDKMFNIFIVNDFEGSNNGTGTIPFKVGEYDEMVDTSKFGTMAMNNYFLRAETEDQDKIIAPHEIGHLFGLLHTFEFMFPCDDNCRENVAANQNGRGENPYTTGDLIGDTHPNPHPILYLDTDYLSNCTVLIDTSIVDECNNAVIFQNMESIQNNIMSYFTCKEVFTTEQVLRMHCIADTYYSNYLNNPTATNEPQIHKREIEVFPNPASTELNFVSQNANVNITQVSLFSTLGKKLKMITGDNIRHIDLTDLQVNRLVFIKIYYHTVSGQVASKTFKVYINK